MKDPVIANIRQEVFANMRKERLRYAIQREIDRQAVAITAEAETLLIDAATRHLEAYFVSDDQRIAGAERAERTLNPVITALAQAVPSGQPISEAACRAALQEQSVQEFPWTTAQPD